LSVLAAVSLSASFALGAPADAPAPAKPTELQLEEGRRHFSQAVALYEERNYEAALLEFQAAYDTAPAASILYNIGLTQKALYRYGEAIAALEGYLASAKEARIKPARRREVVKLIDGMKALLAPVIVNLTPVDAKFTVDGRAVVLPDNRTLQLAAGNHLLVASGENYEPQTRAIAVVAAQPQIVTIELRAIPRTGRVRITSSQPGTAVDIDGQPRGLAPLELELSPGGHQLQARANGFDPYRAEVTLAAGQERNIDIELQRPNAAVVAALAAAGPSAQPAPLYGRWWFWTAVGVVVAGGVATALLLKQGVASPHSGGLGTVEVRQ
jgi:tetratricopeptide (TPR) repeat protein